MHVKGDWKVAARNKLRLSTGGFLYDKPLEMPWAYESEQGLKEHGSDKRYRFFKSQREAQKSARAADRGVNGRASVGTADTRSSAAI